MHSYLVPLSLGFGRYGGQNRTTERPHDHGPGLAKTETWTGIAIASAYQHALSCPRSGTRTPPSSARRSHLRTQPPSLLEGIRPHGQGVLREAAI
ncbi:hypothetical protein DTO280E4_7947 [Paecilomyces variotii]|nr:hypothetical protein DTO212C5_5907 [Paecilomyces variotii]KAJ9352003.1 hypothetical protein DTO280E4_7947 [Paecilomyces variotii]